MPVSEGMEFEPSSRGAEVTKNDIIEKTLKEIGPRLDEHEVPYSEEPDREEIVIAELQKRLPDTTSRPARTSGT